MAASATTTAVHDAGAGLKQRGGKLSVPSGSSTISANGSGVTTPESSDAFVPNAPASAVPPSKVTLQSLLYESGAGDGVNGTVDDWPIQEDLDFSRPVSELLRKGTQRAHTSAETSAGAVALTAGQLELQEYVRWLGLLWRVYDALESGLNAHASDPVLAPTFNPKLLARAPELASDITYLLEQLPKFATRPSANPLATTPSTPLPPFPLPAFMEQVFATTPPPLKVYLDRLRELSASPDQAPRLLAHAYVRYLGDLSGGQVIGARLRKAYGLDGLDGRRFYYFDLNHDTEAAEAGEETVGDRKKKLHAVKGWYRDGMDAGVGDDAKLKASLVKEANLAFVLNTHLFSLINPPAPKRELRYYEKLQLKREEELANRPKKSLRERIMDLVYVTLALAFGWIFFAVIWPFAAPHVERHGLPVWNRYAAPIVDGKLVPFWNDSFLPWWKDHASPILARQMAYSRRAMV